MLGSRVSVIIPTLNEEDSIGDVLRSIPRSVVDEIIVVDTSNDATAKIAENLGARVVHEPRKGYGRAYKTGFSVASGEIIVTLDGDSSYSVAYIPKLVKLLLEKELDFITTNRLTCFEKGSISLAHLMGNHLLSFLTRILFSIKINDSQSGMWIFRKSILDSILPTSDEMAFSEEIKIRAFRNFNAIEVPINYQKRKGQAKLNTLRDGLKNLIHLIKLRLLLNGYGESNG